jgi:hypothetical protein
MTSSGTKRRSPTGGTPLGARAAPRLAALPSCPVARDGTASVFPTEPLSVLVTVSTGRVSAGCDRSGTRHRRQRGIGGRKARPDIRADGSAAGQRGADAANGTSDATNRTGETAQLRLSGQRDQRRRKRKNDAEREPAARACKEASKS